jgi:uncharacterized protein (TIGR03382 family)
MIGIAGRNGSFAACALLLQDALGFLRRRRRSVFP